MYRLNRYARDGSVLSLLPNPLTRVDLTPLASRPDVSPRPTPPAVPPVRPAPPPIKP